MAISTRTITSLTAPITQSNLVSALQTAFTNAGFDAPIQIFTSGTDQILVYRTILDNSKTYGAIFLRLRITNTLGIFQQLVSTWNTGTSSGTDASTEVGYATFLNSINITFNSFNSVSNNQPEVRQVIVTQNSLFAPLGLIFPENRPSRWDLNSYPYGFIWTSNNPSGLRTTTRNPYSNPDFSTYINDSNLSGTSPTGDGNDLARGIILKSISNNGIGCQTSNDIGYGCVLGLPRFTSIPITGTNQAWTTINNVAGGLCLRTQ
ncbi:hypothetical protein [Anabaena azotica]|uniref:Uncharacterized protein n=1 Tax=Anabaena azotica FACHB-119 TaxID=947527 RepID=A0ABR8D7I3_9NOST|nr:hypothetical protein [Anabaena azotica]MBD2503133.1 hypothetical protein [Anabaena azotica FACHB-119]